MSESENISVVSSSERPLQDHSNRGSKGGIKIFGCRTRLASDDFVLPAWIAFLTRVLFLTATVAIMAYSMQIVKTGPSCLTLHNLDIYMPSIIAIMSITGILYLLLAYNSAKGVIWDANSRSRRFVSPLFHTSLVLGVGEIVLVINGTIWISNALNSDCAKSEAEETSMYVILGLIVFKWIGVLITTLIVLVSLKGLWPICCCRSRSKGQRGQLSSENATQWILDHVTDPGECCFYMFKRCCVATKQVDYFNDVADLINDMFEDEAFVPTDIAAALILLSERNSQRGLEELPRSMKNKEIHLRNLEEYMAYSFASYGCAMYLLDTEERLNRCLKLTSKLSICACCCCSPMAYVQDYTEGDNCCFGNLATLKLQVPYINEDDIIHLSMRNQFLETPFLVVADPKLQKIVIAIRGTLSIADLMTDMVAKPISLKAILAENMHLLDFSSEEITAFNEMPQDIECHSGMAEAAIYVFKEIKQKHLLDQAHIHHPDFPIVVTGHSLGAGTAVILAFILRLKYRNVKCFSFAPPGALLSPQASKVSNEFVTSVIVGDDIIPRLSVNAYIKLRNKMRKTLLACKLPKHKVLATGLCNCLSPITWKRRLQQDPSVTNNDDENVESDQLNYGTNFDVEGDAYASNSWSEMLPPGKIIHICTTNVAESEQVTMCFRDPLDFNEILISTRMISDHSPSTYQRAISRAKQRFIRSQASDQDLNPSV